MYPRKIYHIFVLLGVSILLIEILMLIIGLCNEQEWFQSSVTATFFLIGLPIFVVHSLVWWRNRKYDFNHLTVSKANMPIILLLISILLLVEVLEVLCMGFSVQHPYLYGSWKEILSMVVLGPVFEEWIFRGIYLKGLLTSGQCRKWVAVAFVSILFGIIHFDLARGLTWNNVMQVLYASVIGVALSIVYMKFGCLILNILYHMLINGTGIALSLGLSSCEPLSWSVTIGFVLYVLTIPVLYFALRRLWFLS